MADEVRDVVEGDGYAVANVDGLGEGPGFRKVRRALGVTAFGVNAIELPPGFETGRHYHDEQEELYFVHRGRLQIRLNDQSEHVLGPGGLARVDAATVRQIKNIGDEPALYLVAGGKDGYVGRDGQLPEGGPRRLSCTAASPSARPYWRAALSFRPTTTGTCAWTSCRCIRARTRSCARSARTATCTQISAPAATTARPSAFRT